MCVVHVCIMPFSPSSLPRSWLLVIILSFSLVRVNFNIGDDSGDDECLLHASLIQLSLSGAWYAMLYCVMIVCASVCVFAGYMRCAIARVFAVVSVIDLFSSSLHERASQRLAVAHELVSGGEHSSCRDWFECLLRTKAGLSSGESCSEGELNYFNGL